MKSDDPITALVLYLNPVKELKAGYKTALPNCSKHILVTNLTSNASIPLQILWQVKSFPYVMIPLSIFLPFCFNFNSYRR